MKFFVTADGRTKMASPSSEGVCAMLGHVYRAKCVPLECRGESTIAGRSFAREIWICGTCGQKIE